jgi:hypothetical protein
MIATSATSQTNQKKKKNTKLWRAPDLGKENGTVRIFQV